MEITHSPITWSARKIEHNLIVPFLHRLSAVFEWSFRISLSGFALHSGLPVLTVAIQFWIQGELFESSYS